MKKNDLTLIEFTASNPPQIRSHQSWEEVYDMLSEQCNNPQTPYYIETCGYVVTLVKDGKGEVKATLQNASDAMARYTVSGGMWVELSY